MPADSFQDRTPERIDLALGHPGLDLLPLELLRDSAQHGLDHASPGLLQYGPEGGSRAFRGVLSGFLQRAGGAPAAPEELLVSGGISQALDLFCTVFTVPGDLVFVEEPTYFLALRIFADHGLRVRGIPLAQSGLNVRALSDALAEETPVFFYTVPSYQNPRGTSLSEEERDALVALAREHGFTILADEAYHMLRYEGAEPAPFGEYVDSGRVCALGSFSKILAPGLRLGWIHSSASIRQRLLQSGLLTSGGGVAPLTSALLHRLIAEGSLESHIAWLREAYRRRRDALVEGLDEIARRQEVAGRKAIRYDAPAGGYFVWVELPSGSATSLATAAADYGLSFLPGPHFSPSGGQDRFLRLSFSYHRPETIGEGVRRLGELLAAEDPTAPAPE